MVHDSSREKSIGNVYVQFDNSIGLNINKKINESQIEEILMKLTDQLLPLKAVPSVRYGKFFMNVSSKNIELQDKLKNIGLVEGQRSFFFGK